jgi:hypothetical protein
MEDQHRRHSDELLAILVAVGKPFAEAAKLAVCESAGVRRRMDDPTFDGRCRQSEIGSSPR